MHVTDRQVSDFAGGLVDNAHLDLIDNLAAVAASNGIGMVYTPISGWSGRWNVRHEGFGEKYAMKQLTSNREAWRIEARFLREEGEEVFADVARQVPREVRRPVG